MLLSNLNRGIWPRELRENKKTEKKKKKQEDESQDEDENIYIRKINEALIVCIYIKGAHIYYIHMVIHSLTLTEREERKKGKKLFGSSA